MRDAGAHSETLMMEILRQLENAGFRGSAISVRHLPDLQDDFERLLGQGILDSGFYDEIVSRYGLHWDFEPPAKMPTARSVIITAAQQPKISLEFQCDGKKYYGIIPPTYVHDTDNTVLKVASTYLSKCGHAVCDALLPTKLLAVRSGLAQYGKNNVTYIKGWGSYYRLRAYFTDAPCTEDFWQEPVAMDLCGRCSSCIKKCPTGAISQDRFLVDAGKCLTYFNEAADDFPKWVDPAWHNCLIGCMICQDFCPANKHHTNWLMPGGEFSDEETGMILDGISQDRLPAHTTEKLKRVNMLDSYELLQRNLRVLVTNSETGEHCS